LACLRPDFKFGVHSTDQHETDDLHIYICVYLSNIIIIIICVTTDMDMTPSPPTPPRPSPFTKGSWLYFVNLRHSNSMHLKDLPEFLVSHPPFLLDSSRRPK
jgi:hypothetical protein